MENIFFLSHLLHLIKSVVNSRLLSMYSSVHVYRYLFINFMLCTVPKEIDFPRYNIKCSGENLILRGIFHVVSCFLCTTFHAILWKFGLLFGQCGPTLEFRYSVGYVKEKFDIFNNMFIV